MYASDEAGGLRRRFDACHALFDALDRARREHLRGVVAAAGEPCGQGIFCETGSDCVSEDETEDLCGLCVSLPREGEACLFVGEDHWPACSGEGFCVEGRCRTRAPEEGEPCSVIGECGRGLDCIERESREAPGRCESMWREGSPCETGADSRACGSWLRCRDGVCVSELSLGTLGSACGEEPVCRGGFCEDGTCVELHGLGGRCSSEAHCQVPYVCVDGACAEPPARCAGEVGDVCAGSQPCSLGLICLHGEPSRCTRQTGREGLPCAEREHCSDGQCIGGVCRLAQQGDACEYGSECGSLVCTEGVCTASACR
jgi:hypothetical protein